VRTVERTDVVQAEESALEQVRSVGVLPVHPPGEVHQQLVEDPAEEVEIATTVDREHLQRGEGLYRRVDIAEVPLVRRQRAVRVLEPFPADQQQLVLREVRVHVCQSDAVEGEIPGGEPRILPLVRHRHDVEGVERTPSGVAAGLSRGRRFRLAGITVEPSRYVVVVELLAPQHPGEGLPHHHCFVRRGDRGSEAGIELVGLGPAGGEHLVEIPSHCGRRGRAGARGTQPQPQLDRGLRRDVDPVPGSGLRTPATWVDGCGTGQDVVVDSVLGVRRWPGDTVQALRVGLVLAEQEHRRAARRIRSGQQLELSE
jgi:hypothetical protein